MLSLAFIAQLGADQVFTVAPAGRRRLRGPALLRPAGRPGCRATSRVARHGEESIGQAASEEDLAGPMALLQQLLGAQGVSDGSPSAGDAGAGDLGALTSLLGAMGGGADASGTAPGQNPAGMEGLAALLGAGGQKKATDAFFTERLPVLQKVKRPLLAAFFGFAFYRGWVGRWGLLQGLTAGSYFNMLGVPLRVLPRSPLHGRAFYITQLWVDYGFRLLGFLLNWARGKTSPADLFKPAPGLGDGASPWEALAGLQGGDVQSSPVQFPTARTTGTPAPAPVQPPTDARPASRSQPPVIDAEVTFLD